MLFSKKKALSIDTVIGAGTSIDGNLAFRGGLRVDGVVRGNVLAEAGQSSMLVLSEKGRIEGEVRVGHLIVNGTITGPVHAADLLELQSHARVHGEVHYAALEMAQGAVVDGRLVPLTPGDIKALPNLVADELDDTPAVDVPAEPAAVAEVAEVAEATEVTEVARVAEPLPVAQSA